MGVGYWVLGVEGSGVGGRGSGPRLARRTGKDSGSAEVKPSLPSDTSSPNPNTPRPPTPDPLPPLLYAILLASLVLSVLFAMRVPFDELRGNPDENAHLNYVRLILAEGGFVQFKAKDVLYSELSSTVGSEAWNSRDLKSRPH